MAAYWCACDQRLSDSRIPNEIQYYAFSPTQWEFLMTCGDIDVLEIPDGEGEIWRCPQCKRLHWFPMGSNYCQSYRRVSETPLSGEPSWANDEDLYHVYSDMQWNDMTWEDIIDLAKVKIKPFLLKKTETGLRIFDPETKMELTYEIE